MKSRRILVSAILISICLTGAIQTKKFIGSLSTNEGGRLAEQDGRVVLVLGRGGIAPRVDGLLGVWKIGSPYLQTGGKFLALDQSQDGAKVYLAGETGEPAKWVIEVLETTSPQRPRSGSIDERQMLVGTSKSKFRLSVFGGRHKGWYLAANEPTEEQTKAPLNMPLVLDLRLVQNPKHALTLEYVDTSFNIDHK